MNQLNDKYQVLREDYNEVQRKNSIMRSKLANGFLVMKHLKEDLEFSEDCLAIVKSENRKISTIITSMSSSLARTDQIMSLEGLVEMRSQIKDISKISQNASIELFNKQTVKQISDTKPSLEMSNQDSYNLSQKMGKAFEDDASFNNFKTREIAIQCRGIDPKDIGIQNAPMGYAQAEIQTEPWVSKEFLQLKKDNETLLEDFKL